MLLAGAGCTAPAAEAPVAVMVPPAVAAVPHGARVTGAAGGAVLPARPSAAYSAAAALQAPGATGAPVQGDITLDFAATDIRTVVDQILGGILHQNYTIDPAVTGTATLHTVAPLPRAELLPTLQTLLAANHAVLVHEGALYRVMPQSEAQISSVMAADSASAGDQLIQLRYADPVQLTIALKQFVSGSGRIVAFEDQNAVVVEGDPATRRALAALVAAFDVDALAGQSYEIFPVTSGDAKDFATAFTAALGRTAGPSAADQAPDGGPRPPVSVVPLERLNAVLVIAKNESLLFDAQRIYAVINQTQRQTVRSWHVYYLQNGRANDAAYVLQQAFTPDAVTAQPTPPSTGQPAAGLNAPSGGAGGAAGSGGIMGAGLTGAPQSGAAASGVAPSGGAADQGAGATAATASALLSPLSATTAAPAETMRIIPDMQNNSLLIYGTAAEDDQVNAMLAKLDISPVEVRIDATIAEVDLNSALQYGTQFFFKSGGINAVLSTGTTASLATNFPGFVLSGDGSDAAPVAISALQAVTKVHVLSSPELLVLDGQAASLQVGNLVPYLSQTSQSTLESGAPVVNSIDYRETGVILQVTPHVGNDGLVTLDVSQEVSGVQNGVTTAGINSPTFSDRSVTSRVAIADGQTIGLAGLISDNDSHANSGIPFLKNIPLLGDLASSQNNSRTRTELLVLITPHVIRTQNDADALTADLREELPGAAAVPAALQFTPVEGAADPDADLRARIPGAHGG
jgi:general secretion pathway protein D